jgi:hypothetical protein
MAVSQIPLHILLLVTQRFDWIERGGFSRGIKAKKNSNCTAK